MAEQFKAPPVPSRAPATESASKPMQQTNTSQKPVQQQASTDMRPRTSNQAIRSGIQNTQSQMRPTSQQQGASSTQSQNRAVPIQGNRPIQQQGYTNRPQQQASLQTGQPTQQTEGKYDDNFAADFNLPASVLKSKTIGFLMLVVCIFGLVLGSAFFGGNGTPQVVGLQGVVPNQDITTKLPRCGRTDPGQACVLYIMNHTRYDKIAENFFDDAVRLTEVQKYSIAMVNPKYAKTRIPPGYFAEIKIPNVR